MFGVDDDENCKEDDNCCDQYGVKSNIASGDFGNCARQKTNKKPTTCICDLKIANRTLSFACG